MESINTYGIKVNLESLEKASKSTVNWLRGSGGYTEIFYDRSDGDVWTVDQIDLYHNTWTRYHDSDIIKVCTTSSRMSAQRIMDKIKDAVDTAEFWDEWRAKRRAEQEEEYKAILAGKW